MKRLRWALARMLAPERIIRDPFPEEEGVFVYYQSDPAKPYRLEWVVKPDSLVRRAIHAQQDRVLASREHKLSSYVRDNLRELDDGQGTVVELA